MENVYKCSLKISDLISEFEVQDLAEFFCLFGQEVHRMEQLARAEKSQDIDTEARRLIDGYYERFVNKNNRRHSPIASAGMEIEVAKCYLQGKTINETKNYLEKEKGFNTSNTSVGRYWVKFAQLGGRKKLF